MQAWVTLVDIVVIISFQPHKKNGGTKKKHDT